jgi:SAM-dependent methyltransferase
VPETKFSPKEQTQDEIFVDSEGDRWFARNQGKLQKFDPDHDPVIRMMELYALRPQKVVEVGAANGFRLAAIASRFGSKVVGVEPSIKARRDGERRFPHVEFVDGTAAAIPLDRDYDLAIVNFVFHWIDRGNLLRSVAEVDRILRERGYLIIGDFYPANPTRVRYHHLSERAVFTYKQDYSAVFTASGQYQLIAFLSGRHSSQVLEADVLDEHAYGTWLLQKRPRQLYTETSIIP